MYSIHIQCSVDSPKRSHRFIDVCWISAINKIGGLFTQLHGFVYLFSPESDPVLSLQEGKDL